MGNRLEIDHADWMRKLFLAEFVGAEDAGPGAPGITTATTGTSTGATGAVTTATTLPLPPGGDDDDETDEDVGTPRTFTEVEKARLLKESKGYRQRAQKAEGELATLRQKEMSDVDREKSRADTAEARIKNLEVELQTERVGRLITEAAAEANFADPNDVILLLDLAELKKDDEDLPDSKSLKAAIKRLAEAKPYLIRGAIGSNGAGSADGGSRGSTSPVVDYEKQFQARGMVPIP